MDLLLFLIAAAVALIGIAWYHVGYWKRRGIPGPDAVPFLGNLHQLGLANNVPHPFTLREWSRKYGKYYGIQRGWVNALVVSDPKMALEVMSGQFEVFHERDHPPLAGNVDRDPFPHVFMTRGQRWRRMRALTSPAFTVHSLKKILPLVEYSAAENIQHLAKKAEAGGEFNAHTYYREFTMDIICRMALGKTDLKQFSNEYTPLITEILDNIEDGFFLVSWLAPFLGGLLNVSRMATAILSPHLRRMIFLIKSIQQSVSERKKRRAIEGSDGEVTDFIDMFLEAESEDIKNEQDTGGVYDKSNHNIVKKLSLNEVVGQCMLFLFAGFDTTANTLAFSTYYLAKYPEIQRKCREEIDEHCRSAVPTYTELTNLRYCEAVMKEALRHNPIAAVITSRQATCDTTVCGVPVESGTHVVLDVLSLHFNKELWGQDADEFKPERWLDPVRRIPPVFFGFGGGPRICAGMRLAILEQKLYMAHLLRRFRMLPTPKLDEMKVHGYVMHPSQITIRIEDLHHQ